MKNSFLFLFLSFFFSLFCLGQSKVEYASIDKKMAEIPNRLTFSTNSIADYITSNFKTNDEKIRAVFYWTASTISYDIENMRVLNYTDTFENRIKNTLKTRKGVCSDYAEIFKDIAIKAGINAVVINGYTKYNGEILTDPHAWCGANIDNKWYVFDPTWGAGYIRNGVFVKAIDNYYFKTDPSKIISSHIPFDYMWQFLNYTISNREFYNSQTQINSSKKRFDFNLEISRYNNLSEKEQLISSSERIKKNGVINSMILDQLSYEKKKIEYYDQVKALDDFKIIVNLYKEGINKLNEFINYRNKQFRPIHSDEELKRMIGNPKDIFSNCQYLLNNLGQVGDKNVASLNSIKKSLSVAMQLTQEHEKFVFKYLSKSEPARETMFRTIIRY
jgi:hypothetical protein